MTGTTAAASTPPAPTDPTTVQADELLATQPDAPIDAAPDDVLGAQPVGVGPTELAQVERPTRRGRLGAALAARPVAVAAVGAMLLLGGGFAGGWAVGARSAADVVVGPGGLEAGLDGFGQGTPPDRAGMGGAGTLPGAPPSDGTTDGTGDSGVTDGST